MSAIWFNAYGEQIELGDIVYSRSLKNCSLASGKYYSELGYKTPVISAMPIMLRVREANKDYTCDGCGCRIDWGTSYATTKLNHFSYTDKRLCLDCITTQEPSEEIYERREGA